MKWNTNKSGHLQLKKLGPLSKFLYLMDFRRQKKTNTDKLLRRDRIAYCKVHISNTLRYNYNHK